MFFDEFKQAISHEVEEYELGVRAPGRTVEIVACKIHEFSEIHAELHAEYLSLMLKAISDWEAKIIDDKAAAERICAIYRTWSAGRRENERD
jgi:hypothetical protein